MFHPNEPKSLYNKCARGAASILVGLALVISSQAPGSAQQPDASRIDVGYAAIQTVVAASLPGGAEHLTPAILVRIYSDKDRRESFAFSNPDGVAYVPLRPGHYCFEAFNRQGSRLELTETQTRCFEIKKDEDSQVGVELKPVVGLPPKTTPTANK